jgi:hypothetical protein
MNNRFICFLIVLLFVSLVSCVPSVIESIEVKAEVIDSTKCAVATFVDLRRRDDVFGATSLARSLVNSGTTMNMIAITYGTHDKITVKILENEGWKVINAIDILTSQNYEINGDISGREAVVMQSIGEATMSRFFVYMLTDYNIVVYLENDVIVTQNIDELCRCSHAKLGGVSHTRRHRIGAMTLTPSKETFTTITNAIWEGKVSDPYDLFEYFYELQECPYFDPLIEKDLAIPSQQCLRLPVRYNGDVVYQILSGWVDNQIDQPKILHYSVAGMKPWSWWSSILLPQYWVWSTGYMQALRDTQLVLGPTTLVWILETFLAIFVFYLLPSLKRFLSTTIFGFLYGRFFLSPARRLIVFHIFNFFFIVYSFYWSDIYVTHPFMNVFLFVITLSGFMDFILFAHLNSSTGAWTRLFYIVGSLTFFSLFLDPRILPSDFLFRFIAVILWFVFIHAIWFTYLLLSINRFSHGSKTMRQTAMLNPQTPTSSSSSSPFTREPGHFFEKFFENIPTPSQLLSQWSNPNASKQTVFTTPVEPHDSL